MNAVRRETELQDLYRELILDHARTPRNFRRLDDATHSADGVNPLCGDKLKLYLIIDDRRHVADIGFEGSGCAISVASASLMTEAVANLSVEDAVACFDAITRRLVQGPTDRNEAARPVAAKLSKLQALDGVREFPSRVKCATLAWHALHAALHHSPATATSE